MKLKKDITILSMEEEVRILNASAALIQDYVNHEVCYFPENKNKNEIVKTVLPQNGLTRRYFYILLLEIIISVHKEMVENKSSGDNLLTLLQKIANSPKLEKNSDTNSLLMAVNDFINWLDYDFEYDIYSNNIGKEVKIKFKRKEAIYLMGNWCKHSITSLNSVRDKMVTIYTKSGVKLNKGDELLIITDIDDWFLNDFGGYYFTKLCELSSEVYHGIMKYIHPIKQKRTQYDDPNEKVFYRYDIPTELTGVASKLEFYELLNRARNNIWMPKIKTLESLDQDNPFEFRWENE